MSKNPSNGFKSPAPVLPGLGLHSFHNDSPPFAPASQHAQRDPEYFSLDESASPHGRASPVTLSFSGDGTTAEGGVGTAINGHDGNHGNHGGHGNHIVAPVPVPIQQRGFNPNSDTSHSTQQGQGQQQQSRPAYKREPTSSADDVLSTSRSRRLLSGYLFGNPPSPGHEIDDSNMTGTTSTLGLPTDSRVPTLEQRHSSPTRGPPNPTPPSQTRDSTPVSTVSSLPDRPESGNLTARMGDLDLDEASGASFDVAAAQAEVRRRRQSRARDREIGYDALSGLNDGEADADANAPQANFGTRPYLLGEEGPAGEYRFPRHRLRTRMKDESKIPIVIVACGSFSPPTYLHLRMFEMAKDEVVESQTYEIMAGYYSPVSSYYKKAGLAPAIHRVRMCELAVEHTSTWLMVDPWEAGQPEYTRTAVVLEHFNEMLNVEGGGLTMSDGKRRRYKIMLLAGGDLIESFGEPGVWSEPDLHIILGRFGCLIVERAGSDVWAFLLSHDILYHHRRNVIVIKQLIYNDISSTKVRLFVKRGMSIKYLLPNSVIQYIYDNKLYRAPEGLNAIGAGAPMKVEDGPIS